MFWLDWILVVIPLLIVVWVALKGQKYVRGVSDFLAAGRCAGRYVVSVAGAEAGMGLISVVAMVEMYYKSGFAISFWSKISVPLTLIFALTGYCVYRFRETKALTMGQFLEMRYNRAFRILAAVLQSVSGIINYALFPAVGARFMIYFLDLPTKLDICGWVFPTFGLVMAFFLLIALMIIMLGGQITIMVTDCIQGLLSYPMYVAVVGFILWEFSWDNEMVPVLLNRAPDESFVNPYNIAKLRDFNLVYVIGGIVSSVINRMSWQGTAGYNAAARTPHEQKMGGLLGTWRSGFSFLMFLLMGVAAITYLNHPDYAGKAKMVRTSLARKTLDDVVPGIDNETRAKLFANYEAIPEEKSMKTVSDPEVVAILKERAAQAEKPYEVVVVPRKLCKSCTESGIAADNCRECVKIMQATELAQEKPYLDATKQGLANTEYSGNVPTFNAIFGQMLVPIAMREMLPIGITGIFCALMIFLMVSTDTTYIHSWGSIIVQDLVVPFLKKPLTPKQQLTLLRCAAAFVGAFAFFFSLFFAQVDFILMFFAITGAIWMAGAGPVIVFGLYWKRGTVAAAFTTIIVSSSVAVSGILLQNNWAKTVYPFLERHGWVEPVGNFLSAVSAPLNPYIVWVMNPDKFPINSQEISFMTTLFGIVLYMVVSLLTCRKPFNLERLLHRGKYSDDGVGKVEKFKWTWKNICGKVLGIDPNYTTGDKILAWSVFLYSFVFTFLFIFLLYAIWGAISPFSDLWWAEYFYWTNIIVSLVVGIVSTVWFSIGGTIDLIQLFKDLAAKEANELDDGRVEGEVSAADAAKFAALEKEQAAEEK